MSIIFRMLFDKFGVKKVLNVLLIWIYVLNLIYSTKDTILNATIWIGILMFLINFCFKNNK